MLNFETRSFTPARLISLLLLEAQFYEYMHEVFNSRRIGPNQLDVGIWISWTTLNQVFELKSRI